MADNYIFDITGADLDKSLAIALDGAPGHQATHWGVWGKGAEPIRLGTVRVDRLVFYWHRPESYIDCMPLITPLGKLEEERFVLGVMIKEWLKQIEYPPEPRHDGDNTKGWRIFNEPWGHVMDSHYGIFAVEPVWMMHGK